LHPRPGAIPEEGRLLRQVKGIRQRVVGYGRIPFLAVGEVIEIPVPIGECNDVWILEILIPSQHEDRCIVPALTFVNPPGHLPGPAEDVADERHPI
jgi:hypothetical protein